MKKKIVSTFLSAVILGVSVMTPAWECSAEDFLSENDFAEIADYSEETDEEKTENEKSTATEENMEIRIEDSLEAEVELESEFADEILIEEWQSETEENESGEKQEENAWIEDEFVDEDADFELDVEEWALAGEVNADVGIGLCSEVHKESDNRNKQDYSVWSWPVYSYLRPTANGFMRVEYVNQKVLVASYDSNLVLLSEKYISPELPYFGGFYEGSDAYYLVFGQENYQQNDAKEVIRVVKYTKNWERLGCASVLGSNTYQPFEAGSLRMTEAGGYLYIRTSHKMYKSSDGLNHQANMTIEVQESSMKVTDCAYTIMNHSVGYVSHSFNQFILVDDLGKLVALDHGDAYPRSALLGRYVMKADTPFSGDLRGGYASVELLKYYGSIGQNSTGASIGGLEYSSSSYLTAGNSVVQNGSGTVRNVYVTSTPKDNFTAGASRILWMSNYSSGGASTPHLVKLGSDSFLLLWTEKNSGNTNGSICYVFLDGYGNAVSTVYKAEGYLSDCKPIAVNGTAVWYITDSEKLTFYKVLPDGNMKKEVGHRHTYEPKAELAEREMTCGLIEGSVKNVLTTNSDGEIFWSSSNPSVARVDTNGIVTLTGLGECMITASITAGIDYAAKSISYPLHVLDLKKQNIKVQEQYTCTYGDSSFNLDVVVEGGASVTYQSANEKIAKVSADGKVTIGNVGKTEITIRASRIDTYANGQKTVTIEVKPKPIEKCHVIFTKVGNIDCNFKEVDKYLAVVDGSKVLDPVKDMSVYVYSISGWNSLSVAYVSITGYGNYCGGTVTEASPISGTSVLSKASYTSKGVKVTWKKENAAVGYVIYRKVAGESKYKLVKNITKNSTYAWTDTSTLSINKKCTYYVRAYTLNQGKKVYAGISNRLSVDLSSCKVTGRHKYGNWKTVTAATVFKDGSKKRQCSVCKKTENGTIAKLTPTLTLSITGTYSLKLNKTVTTKVSNLAKGDYVVSWASSDKKIAVVTGGKVTGKGVGTAKITVTLKSGKKGSFKVNVKK